MVATAEVVDTPEARSSRELRKFLDVFLGGVTEASPIVVELRALEVPQKYGNPKVEFGFFELYAGMKPPTPFGLAMGSLLTRPPEMQPEGIYVAMNPVCRDLVARSNNKLKVAKDKGLNADDKDIVSRRWMVVDLDPVRPKKISASDAEKAAAHAVALGVREDLRSRGWTEAMFNDSGNGFHLWYRVDLPRDDNSVVEHALKALAKRHNTPAVTVDTTLFNPSRIVKLPGTWARKGDSIPERPHRMARVLEVNNT